MRFRVMDTFDEEIYKQSVDTLMIFFTNFQTRRCFTIVQHLFEIRCIT